jgi:hypothetical protein
MSTPEKSTAERPAMMPVAELLEMAAPYNPRKISESELGLLRQSLREFGLVQPVIVNAQTGNIVGGHQRVLAAQMELISDLDVVWVDLDPTREKQLNLALNKISGEWDDEKLRDVLLALDEEGAGLGLTGFEDAELERIMGSVFDEVDLPDGIGGADGSFHQMTFVLSAEQAETVALAIKREVEDGGGEPSLGNENRNGCALYSIAVRSMSVAGA